MMPRCHVNTFLTGLCLAVAVGLYLGVSLLASLPTAPMSPQDIKMLHMTREEFFRRQPHQVNNFHLQFLLNEKHLCKDRPFAMIIIHSYHGNTDRRRQIRETWVDSIRAGTWPGRQFKYKVAYAFIFGSHKDKSMNDMIKHESLLYGDIIQGNFTESYHNMTHKNIMGLQWTSHYCKNVPYLIKCDDDIMLNLPQLLGYLSEHSNVSDNRTYYQRSIIGSRIDDTIVIREHFHLPYNTKWALPKTVFPFKYYPHFVYGAAYVITGDIITDLYEASKYVPYIFIDDMYVTGILRTVIGANVIGSFQNASNNVGFVANYRFPPHVCLLVNDHVYSLMMEGNREIFIKLKQKEVVCTDTRNMHCTCHRNTLGSGNYTF